MMEALYRAWLRSVRGMTNLRMDILMEKNGPAREVHARAKSGDLMRSGALPNALYEELRRSASSGALERLWEKLEKLGIRVCCPEDGDYPALLKEMYDPPRVLFARGRGDLAKLSRAVAVVGSRNCSDYARRMAGRISKNLAEANVTVVSGMAFGVDAAAHEGALQSGTDMATVAVLASGVDRPSPAEHAGLYARILERGLVLSEQPVGHAARAGDFPVRNRIIAGLSHGVFVAEARKKSGTWHTINFALDAGREVFALPGRAEDPCCEGSLAMLKEGAALVTSAMDILAHFGWDGGHKARQTVALSDEEQRVVSCLKQRDMTADELFEQLRLPMNRLLSLLTNMALRGIIERKSCMEYHYIMEG